MVSLSILTQKKPIIGSILWSLIKSWDTTKEAYIFFHSFRSRVPKLDVLTEKAILVGLFLGRIHIQSLAEFIGFLLELRVNSASFGTDFCCNSFLWLMQRGREWCGREWLHHRYCWKIAVRHICSACNSEVTSKLPLWVAAFSLPNRVMGLALRSYH